MTALPPVADLVNTGISKGTFKAALTSLRAHLYELLGGTGAKADALAALGSPMHGRVDKVGAYTVVADDRGKVIACSGTWTLSLTDAATLADGFVFAVLNSGAGVITIDPYLSQTIDGATTKTVSPNGLLLVYCDGTAFSSVGGGAGRSAILFTSSGTFDPQGATSCVVTVVGGGGGGGAGYFADVTSYSGGDGGNAGKCRAFVTGLSGNVTVTVGAGGAGSNTGNGSSGGTSSFGSYVTCTGGHGGQAYPGTNGSNGSPSVSGATIISGQSLTPLEGVERANGSSRSAGLAYSPTGTYMAGDGGAGESGNAGDVCGGIGGFVLVEY